MELQQTGLHEFKVVLTQSEFTVAEKIAASHEVSVQTVLKLMFESSLLVFGQRIVRKES